MAHKRTAGHYQVWTSCKKRFIDQEILLLPTEVHPDAANILIEIIANICSSFVEGINRTNKRGLIVEGFASIGYENRRNTESVFNHERR